MTWPEVQKAAESGYVPILVVGATEQHGPHLPLATDVVIPCELVKRLAIGVPVLLAPAITFGFKSKALSGGGQTFPGTISVDGATLMQLVREVVAELVRHGFRQIVVLNWHMENVNFVWEGIDQARRDRRLEDAAIVSIDSLSRSFSSRELAWLFPDGSPDWAREHASMVETSLMLALRPDLVHRDRVADDAAHEHPWYDVIPEPTRHIPASGVLASPSRASEAIGERLCEMYLARLAEAVCREFDVHSDGAPSMPRSGGDRTASSA